MGDEIPDAKMEVDDESRASFVTTTTNIIGDGAMVSCGRCGENISYLEYKTKHRQKHYNLCWLEGDEKLDYLNEKRVAVLIREILPKFAERDKKISFICEWCGIKMKSVLGYACHVKKCAVEQKLAFPPNETVDEEIIPKYEVNSKVICGRCHKSMLQIDYEKKHRLTHYNLCWLSGGEKLDFDDENVTQNLLRKSLPKYAARQKKVKFTCEWCQIKKRSVPGFASHIKHCKSRPDKLGLLNESGTENDTVTKSDIEITKERDASIVTCGRCNEEMTRTEYCTNHCSKHYNLCWIVGEDKPDLVNYNTVLTKLKQLIPFKDVRNRTVKLTCEDCKSVKKSLSGFASHVIFCSKTANDVKLLLVTCENCGSKVKPSSLFNHKLKNCCKMVKTVSINGQSHNENDLKAEGSLYALRRKKRPPNILSFHPDTKYVTEYYDCMCRLCDFITLSVSDIINHIFIAHDIDIKNIKNKKKLEDYILNKYDSYRNMYLGPLLNYYNYFKKTFWKANFHEDFQPDIQNLMSDEAIKYLPSVQQSCKIFISDKEQICVDLFKSAHVNGMHWLFTGGPIWAMSWCPVPEDVQTQYLAISCHPEPDLVHKEMNIYKYPSLVQLWTFDSLNNINYEKVSSMPYMSYGLAHEFGAVWDMAWCPSGAYEPETKIGLLALSTSCGDCPMFAMPCVDGNSEMFYIYKAKPVIARYFECEWIEEGVQCTKVCWQAVSPFKTLICGYSNGMVNVFHINLKSIFLNDDILYPSHTFRASRCSITGLSVNCLNCSILATTANDGYVSLWDLKATESPIFQKKSFSPSDCTWLQQCYTLVFCSKGVNPQFLRVRTLNFSNFDDDFDGYNPELYVLTSVANSSKVISDCKMMNNDDKLNFGMDNCEDTNENVNGNNINMVEDRTLNDSSMNSDAESSKSVEPSINSDQEKSNNVKCGDVSRNIDDDDYYGPTFFQKSTHWSVAGSNWMNVIATGDECGVIYEKLFLSENNQFRKGNSTTHQLIVTKLSSNDTLQSKSSSKGYRFEETIKEFALESRFILRDENIKNNQDKPLLRYPLDNITKVSWNQNFNSFRWLASGTQSGFTLVSPSRTLSDTCIESFYKTILKPNFNNENVKTNVKTDISK